MNGKRRMMAVCMAMLLVVVAVRPSRAETGTPAATETSARTLYTVPFSAIPPLDGIPAGVMLWRGDFPADTPVPVLGGPGSTILLYAEGGALEVEIRKPISWADPADDYAPRTVRAGEVAVLPPTNAATVIAHGAPAVGIVLTLWLPTTIVPSEADRHDAPPVEMMDAAVAAGFRETGIAYGNFFDFPEDVVEVSLEEVTIASGGTTKAGVPAGAEEGGVTSGAVTLVLEHGAADQVWPDGVPQRGIPATPTAIRAGDELALQTGGFYLLPPGSGGVIRNDGDAPAVLLRVIVVPAPVIGGDSTPVD